MGLFTHFENGIRTTWSTEKLLDSSPAPSGARKQMVGRTTIGFLHAKCRLAAASNYAAFATAAAVAATTRNVAEATNGGSDGTDDYVAMASPCESPVGRRIDVHKDGRNAASEPGNFTSSTSSRSVLVTRLSSALQSWTSGRCAVGDELRLGPPREGRPGPYEEKYTQERMKNKVNEHSAFAATAGVAKVDPPKEGNGESKEDTPDRGNTRENGAPLRGTVDDPKLVMASAPVVSKTVQEENHLGTEAVACSTNDSGAAASSSVDQRNQDKKKGLWEWKAERSRLEQAIKQAEAEREKEKARADEAAILLKEAITHPDGC